MSEWQNFLLGKLYLIDGILDAAEDGLDLGVSDIFDPAFTELWAGDFIRTRPVADSTDILDDVDRAVEGRVLNFTADFGLEDKETIDVLLGSL